MLLAALTIALIVVAVLGLRTPSGRVLVTAGSALFGGFVAGHGWWTGIGDIGLLLPNTNSPTAGSLIWLVLLPVLAWAVFRIAGGAVARKPETGETSEQALAREVQEELGVKLSCIRPAFTIQAPAHGFETPTTLTMLCFYAAAHGRPRPAREIAELAWLDISVDGRAPPALAQVLQQLD